MHVPDYVTHYHLADRLPFLNLSDLADDELTRVMADLKQLRQAGRQHRPFGSKYMALRRLAEAKLHALFREAGGRPERTAPHYFVLGESAWYERLADEMAHVRLPLSALPPDKTSLTCPDSFTAMDVGPQFALTVQRRPWHGRIYLLESMPDLLEQVGLPSPAWTDEHRISWTAWPHEAYIEVQLWTDEPVSAYLS